MTNYWVITVGINQYRHIQPLMHAQNDALFTHRFFTEEASIAANRCVLLSDLATSVGSQVVYPDKLAIAQWLQTITQQVEPGDVLWFFFSGYGTQQDGADYLMPIDGDPDQIAETGIALSELIDTLAQLPTDKAILVLDINRSQGALAGHTIGTQAIELAQKRQVATLLSCQPEQYSHETLGVRHGLFTATLLEALQQGCSTLGQIDSYLTKRLPELCEHHWRPVQNAVVVMSDEQKIATVAPELVTSINSVTAAVASPVSSGKLEGSLENDLKKNEASPVTPIAMEETAGRIDSPDTASKERVVVGAGSGLVGAGAIANQDRAYPERSTDSSSYQATQDSAESIDSNNDSAIAPGAPNKSAIVPYEKESSAAIDGAKLRNWGLLALALLMGLVLLKQPFVKAAWDNLIDKLEVATGWGPEEAAGETAQGTPVTGEPDSSEAATPETEPVIAAAPNSAAPAGGPEEAPPETASAPVEKGAESDSSSEITPESKAAAAALMAKANTAIEQQQYSEALITLQEVPQAQRDDKFSALLVKARAGAAEAQQTNASLLTDARTAIQPTQASQFTQAIAKARLIQPGEPYYDEAQKDISGWSQVILDIAEGRASSGSLEGAIAAAKVMPRDSANAYQKAQDRIAFWQRRQQSRTLIENAKTIPKSGQASTYQDGIVKLREVPIEHPEYETAQRLADEWSDRIFSISQARAAQGRQEAAIQAALLVPAGTTAYEPTQQAIRRWRTELKN